MIVFDGSGSIWGRIEGDKRSKFDVAREGVRQALAKASPTARIGLTSFGHRRKGDCSDAEVIVPVDAGSADRIIGPLDKLNPRGKGPVVLAMREAARAMKDRSPGSIVIIADNADNCVPDACAAAEDIAKTQPGLAVHVVGIGLDAEEARKMACIPKATKGKFQNVENAAALTAAIGEAMRLALLGGTDQPSAAVDAKLQGLPKAALPPASPEGPPMLSLAAKLGSETDTLDMPIRWRVTRDGDTTVPVIESTAPIASAQVPPGKYTAEARIGLVTVRQPVEVKTAGTTALTVPLDAAAVMLNGRGAKATEQPANAVITVLAAADGKPLPQAPPLLVSRDSDGVLVIPAGSYVIRVEHGLAAKDFAVQATAGARVPIDTTLGAGRLQLWAEAQEGGELQDGALFTISEDDPNSPQGRREIARSVASRPEFIVPSGTYYVTAQLGPTAVRQRVAVSTGDTVKRGIVLGVAKLQVAIDVSTGKAELPLLTRVTRIDGGEAREIARGTGRKPEFTLPAGRYRVEAQAGEQNARVAGEVEIKPGRNLQMAMRIDAGQIALRAVESPGGFAFADAFWEIQDGKGTVVWRTSQPEPRAVLAPGRYVVRSEVRTRRIERTVDVAAGEVRTVEIGPQ